MRAFQSLVVAHEVLAGGLSRLRLAAPSLGALRPGQGVAIWQPGALTIGARPFFPVAVDPRAGTCDLLYPTAGAVAVWLSSRPPGAVLDALAPWGRPFPVHRQARHVVLAASGTRLIGLLALCTTLIEAGASVVVLNDAQTAESLLPPAVLPAAAEYHVATRDGSAGTTGTVLDLLPALLPWADALYAALAPSDYPLLRDLAHRHRLRLRRGFATVLLEAPLACYAAACDGCAVSLRDGYGLLCRDGPSFDLLDL